MKELKCPKCGNVFQVDEADYASIVSQVRGKEFEAELKLRTESIKREMEAQKKADEANAELENNKKLNDAKQDVKEREAEIERLKTKLETIGKEKDAERTMALTTQENDIAALRAEIKQEKSNARIAVMEAENKVKEQLQAEKDDLKNQLQEQKDKVHELESQAKLNEREIELREQALKDQHQKELAMKDEVIAQYKDFKTSLSTKMIGESLEVYCSNQFELNIHPYMPEAYFGKDNNIVDGTKGDFVFRDMVDGMESVSIMFEMKNEADNTVNKHKNVEFFDKLDKDRKKKKCEYAVLVSMLELDNELYNNGIYAVPSYEKMFVIRPQQFLTIIAILTQMGRNTVKVKKELSEAKNKEIDVTHFEENISNFKTKFSGHVKDAANRYNDALADIDKAIEKLTDMRDNLRLWVDHLYKAEKNFDELEVKKLTKGNPTMKAKFEEARRLNAQEGIENL